MSADATQIRFTAAVEKSFALSIARVVNNQARALAISGVGGSPGNDVDITLSPELSVVRVGNRGAARNLTVKALSVDRGGQPVDRNLPPVAVPKGERPGRGGDELAHARPSGAGGSVLVAGRRSP